jgi:hypothetical protein
MYTHDQFFHAAMKVPQVSRALTRAHQRWEDNVPASLEFALVGKVLADHFEQFTPMELQVMHGVLWHGLYRSAPSLRHLVVCPLISTCLARARRKGGKQERRVRGYLMQVAGLAGIEANDAGSLARFRSGANVESKELELFFERHRGRTEHH